MNIRNLCGSVLLSGCLAGIWCVQVVAQQNPPPPPTPAPADPAPQGSGVPIKVEVNAVLVPVVVRDGRGDAVGSLQKEDFEVFDQGKLQVISGFTIEKRGAGEIAAKPAAPADPRVPVPDAAPPATPAPASAPKRFIVFLFDDLHLDFGDLAQVQAAAKRMLAGSLGDSDMADVVSFSGTNSGMTRDRAKLQEAIMQLRVRNLYRQVGRPCPNVDYYLADLIVNRHDDPAFESAVQDTMTCANLKPQERNMAEGMVRSAASQALAVGDQDTRVTLLFIRELAHRMEALPGDRMVILVSPGFLANSAEAQTLKSRIMDVAAQSKVTVSALDARGLYTTNLDASQRGEGSAYGLVTAQASQQHSGSMTVNENVMAELADGTGGTFFHNSNDLDAGFKRLTEAPEYLYLLEVSPQNVKANGSYHTLKVKVRQGGLKVQARRGYYAPNAEKSKK
jgi:VWFA-related protein